MKRSTQIGLAAAGVVLVATIWANSGDDTQEDSFVYNSLAECRAAGQLSSSQCEARFNEATANHLRDAKKFTSTSACETEYGSGSCRSAVWNGAQVIVPALAGIMLARSLSQGGGAAQPCCRRHNRPARLAARRRNASRPAPHRAAAAEAAMAAAAAPRRAPIRRPPARLWWRAAAPSVGSPARARHRAAALARPRIPSVPHPRPEMRRVVLEARADWQAQVERLGFAFHTIDGATYWDERAAYAFTLDEIERDIEAPTEAIEQLCFAFIEKAIDDDAVLTRLAIPDAQWAFIRESWQRGERNLYGRLDLAYDGRGRPSCSNTMPTRRPPCSNRAWCNGTGSSRRWRTAACPPVATSSIHCMSD